MLKAIIHRQALAVILTAAVIIAPALAQKDDQVIKIESNLIVVDTTVTDKNGNFIRNLKAEDFAVYEDGELQKIDFFEAGEVAALTRPLAIVFAFDVSGSIKPEEVVKQREAAENFLKLVQPESVFAIIAFNNEIQVLQDFTNDPKKIAQAFRKFDVMGGSSRIFGSIDRAVTMLKRAPRFRKGRRLRRVVIVISDGISTDRIDDFGADSRIEGRITLPAGGGDKPFLVQRANDAEVTVYSITLPSYPMGGPASGQRIMTLLDVSQVVPLTGGADFSADASDFAPVFKAIAEEIRSGYTIAYYPPEKSRRDGRLHQLRVEVKKSGAILRANRTSYQAPR
jgi:Ca-activated chloride channel homolog